MFAAHSPPPYLLPVLLHPSLPFPGLERDKFDNKTVSFEEHIKYEHNMWNYLYFIVLVRVKNKTDYTGPESYVAQMIKVQVPSGQLLGHPNLPALGTRGWPRRNSSGKSFWKILANGAVPEFVLCCFFPCGLFEGLSCGLKG